MSLPCLLGCPFFDRSEVAESSAMPKTPRPLNSKSGWSTNRRPTWQAGAKVAQRLSTGPVGAYCLLGAALVALVWANSPWRQAYHQLAQTSLGWSQAHLDLTVTQWASDGLLTIFFFVVGLELKRELVVGSLRRWSRAVVPVVAAIGGMAVPAGIYVLVNLVNPAEAMRGWAIPVATDIAFALAVLSAFGRRVPAALRAFLLTLAVADDLFGILIIATCYAASLQVAYLVGAGAAVAAFAVVVRWRRSPAVLLAGLAVTAWYCLHASGVHATISGVALAFTVPAVAHSGQSPKAASLTAAEHYERWWRPVSAGLAAPLFAFFAAGVEFSPTNLAQAAADPAAQGVALGLVLGKPLGIVLTTLLLVRLTKATLDLAVRPADLVAVGCVAGIGFTVSLLIGTLAFPVESPHNTAVKTAVLLGSATSAIIGAILLHRRSAWHAHQDTRGVVRG